MAERDLNLGWLTQCASYFPEKEGGTERCVRDHSDWLSISNSQSFPVSAKP